MLYVVVAVVVIAAVIVGVLWASGAFSAKSSSSSSSGGSVTVVPNATASQIPGSTSSTIEYFDSGLVDLTSHSNWAINGTFTASGGGVSYYVLTSTEYNAWLSSPTLVPGSYIDGSQNVVQGHFNFNIAGANYYFIWINPSSSSTALYFTSAILATPS